tara:strand:- start:2657 stop:2887 length:231 start_codon:yes stop_codon:yes gene_type:complete
MTKILNRKEVAELFGVSQKTLQKQINELKEKHPNNSCLNRYIGKRQIFTEGDVNQITELLCSKSSQDLTENLHTGT